MRKLTRRAIDKKASELLEKHGILSPPVDVERLAQLLQIQIRLENLPQTISGFLHRDGDNAAIVVNRRHSLQRRRFTIAHELGHFVLDHQTENIHVEKDYRINVKELDLTSGAIKYRRKVSRDGYPEKDEVHANAFAAALLMPEAMIRLDMKVAIDSGHFDDSLINSLAQKYNVSEHALVIQLNTLDLTPTFF